MSLYLELLVLRERIHDDLDGARLVCLIDTCKEGASVMKLLDLVQIHALFKEKLLFSLFDLSNRFVLARGKHPWNLIVTVSLEDAKASEIDIGFGEGPDGLSLVQRPHMDGRVEGGGNETRVILQPRDRSNVPAMRFEGIIDRVLRRVEVVDVDEVDEHAREKVTPVREHDLTTMLDWQVLVLLDCVRKNVHHSYSIIESNGNLKACRVEGHTFC